MLEGKQSLLQRSTRDAHSSRMHIFKHTSAARGALNSMMEQNECNVIEYGTVSTLCLEHLAYHMDEA